MGLLVVLGIHEAIIVAVAVQELHVDLIDVDLLDRVGRAEAVFEHGAGAQVAQLGLDKGAEIAGGTVLDGEHGMQIIVELNDHAGTELGRGNRHCWFTSPSLLPGIFGSEAGPGSPAGPFIGPIGVRSPGASAALEINFLFYTGGERYGNRANPEHGRLPTGAWRRVQGQLLEKV